MPQGLLDDLKINLQMPSKIELPAGQIVDLRHVDRTAAKLADSAGDILISTALALGIISLGWFLSNALAGRIQRFLVRAHVEETLAAFLGSVLRYSVFFGIVIFALSLAGMSSTSLAALIGATGLAIGLATKNTIGHVASGIMLMIHRPFKVGDYIQTQTQEGIVKRTGLFSTEINTLDNKRVFIPNTVLWDNPLTNFTYNRTRMLRLDIPLSYEQDTAAAIEVIRDVLRHDSRILNEPAPRIGIKSFGTLALECEVSAWIKTADYVTVRLNLPLDLKNALNASGFILPYTVMGKVQPLMKPRTAPAKNRTTKRKST